VARSWIADRGARGAPLTRSRIRYGGRISIWLVEHRRSHASGTTVTARASRQQADTQSRSHLATPPPKDSYCSGPLKTFPFWTVQVYVSITRLISIRACVTGDSCTTLCVVWSATSLLLNVHVKLERSILILPTRYPGRLQAAQTNTAPRELFNKGNEVAEGMGFEPTIRG
jgi:hypothetical protein